MGQSWPDFLLLEAAQLYKASHWTQTQSCGFSCRVHLSLSKAVFTCPLAKLCYLSLSKAAHLSLVKAVFICPLAKLYSLIA